LTDFATFHFRGTLIDGTVFESSHAADQREPSGPEHPQSSGDQPYEFPVNSVFDCWRQGLPMLRIGGKARLVCPASLGYGDAGEPRKRIPGGATLVFEVEMISSKPGPKLPPPLSVAQTRLPGAPLRPEGPAGVSKPGGDAPVGVAPGAAEESKALYALGVLIGGTLDPYAPTPEHLRLIIAGLEDSRSDKKPQLERPLWFPEIRGLRHARSAVAAEPEKARGKVYTDDAARQPGAVRTASGLVYIPIQEGAGEHPRPDERVLLRYRGELIDGTVFDSTAEGEPPNEQWFGNLNGRFPCWGEGLPMMRVGGKARLVCPSSLGYGDEGLPPKIPSGATLVFEVEMLGTKPAAEAQPASGPPSLTKPSGHQPRGASPPTE
jgi:FKBP-type peptidyl-prolyl cis-trans isomerase FkpA